jgi:hypothetical protein
VAAQQQQLRQLRRLQQVRLLTADCCWQLCLTAVSHTDPRAVPARPLRPDLLLLHVSS